MMQCGKGHKAWIPGGKEHLGTVLAASHYTDLQKVSPITHHILFHVNLSHG